MNILPTGHQYRIESGPYAAVVTEVGATLRSLTHEGQEVLWTFTEDEAPRASMGHQLLPWPNRIRDGRYTFDGVDYQVPVNEVARNNAIHGLGSNHAWRLLSHGPDEVVLGTVIYPQQGWGGVLAVEICHVVDDGGLTVIVTARNVGARAVPYGYGAHPYLALDPATATITTPFEREIVVDDRLLPVSLGEVSAEHDFRKPRIIGDLALDNAFRVDEGGWEVTVSDDGRTTTMWTDATMPWGQLFIPPTRDALAVEPLTCAANAYNEGPTHEALIVLDPGAETTSKWGIRVAASAG